MLTGLLLLGALLSSLRRALSAAKEIQRERSLSFQLVDSEVDRGSGSQRSVRGGRRRHISATCIDNETNSSRGEAEEDSSSRHLVSAYLFPPPQTSAQIEQKFVVESS